MPIELAKWELSGSPREMGRAHGESLRDLVRRFIAVRFEATAVYLGERGVPAGRFLEVGAACMSIAARWDPEGIEEHLGIAEGADVDPARLYAATNMTDVRDVIAYPSGDASAEGCSTVLLPASCTRDGGPIAAQTWDLNPEDVEYVVALHRRPTVGPETWSITCAGALTLMGMNEHGLAVGTNNVKVLRSRPGAGYLSLLHRAIRCRTAGEAAEILSSAPRAAAHVYWMADPERAVELECSSERAVARALGQEPLWRTNHCLDAAHQAGEGEPPQKTSLARYERLRLLLADQKHDLGSLQALFADRADGIDSICRLPEDGTGSATNACLVACPRERRLWACRGPASRGRWEELGFGS